MIKRLCLAAAIITLFLSQSIAMADGGNLWRLAGQKGSIKIFIHEPDNESGQSRVIRDVFKKALESALVNRKSVKFEIVKTPEESDVQIFSLIKSFQYMEKGPLKPTPGIGTTLLDAAATMTENYVEMAAEFVVKQTATGVILWKDVLTPYIKKKMEPEESVPLISDKIAGHFVWKCFGKPE